MASPHKQTHTAFNWAQRSVETPKEVTEPKWPPGMVTKSDINTLGKLATALKSAHGKPLRMVDAKGKILCQIFSAQADLSNIVASQRLQDLLQHLDYNLKRMGDDGVIKVYKDALNLGSVIKPDPVTVAYFAGKDLELANNK